MSHSMKYGHIRERLMKQGDDRFGHRKGPKKPIPTPPTANQLFIIGHDAWSACTVPEVEATCAVLREAGLYALPFDKVDLELLADDGVNWVRPEDGNPLHEHIEGLTRIEHPEGPAWHSHFGPGVVVRFEGLSTTPGSHYTMKVHDRRPGGYAKVMDITKDLMVEDKYEIQRQRHCNILIALLATRNAVKDTRQNKLAKLGIGKKGKHAGYEYVTTISTPKPKEMSDDEEHPPTGRTVCPHLRRAHLRNQAYGPGRQFRRPKLIQSMFVNVDHEWTKTRVGYNVSL